MQISSYMFQSPYSQPVQIGRPDPAMLREQMQQAQESQKKNSEAVSALAETQQSSSTTTLNVYQTSQGMQQSKEATESFQSANRNSYVQAYVQNSMDS